MARKRKELGAVVEAAIVELMRRGGTAESIAKATGVPRATIGRRMREISGKVSPGKGAPPPVAPIPVEVPEDAPVEVLDRLLEDARQGAELAKADKNLAQLATMGRLSVQIMEAKRKAEPLPTVDINENPDMKALAIQVRERLHVLVDKVFT